MDIISASERLKLLEHITRLRYQLAEWLIVEVKVTDNPQKPTSSTQIAELLHNLFRAYNGMVIACNPTEVLMLIRWGKENNPQDLAKEVRTNLPAGICESKINPPTKEGLKKIILTIIPPDSKDGPFFAARITRDHNVFLIADDDMYMRALVKAGIKDYGNLIEIGNGSEVVSAYKQYNPDIVLLDIHLPGQTGQEILDQLKAIDPKAYIVMLSADSSPENVKWTHQHGAKGFMAKPFNKAKLIEYIESCPTLI